MVYVLGVALYGGRATAPLRMQNSSLRIEKIELGSQRSAYQFYANIGGRKFRERFASEIEAIGRHAQLKAQEQEHNNFPPLMPTPLNRSQLADAEIALEQLRSRFPDRTLTWAVTALHDLDPAKTPAAASRRPGGRWDPCRSRSSGSFALEAVQEPVAQGVGQAEQFLAGDRVLEPAHGGLAGELGFAADGDGELLPDVYASLVDYLEENGQINNAPWDSRATRNATCDNLDPEKITRFVRRARKARNFPLPAEAEIAEVLTQLNLLHNDIPTHAAILLFGRQPQRFILPSEVKCAHFHGTEVAKPIPSY